MRVAAWAAGVPLVLLVAACGQQSQIACNALRSAPYAHELDAYRLAEPGAPLPRTADEALAALDRMLTPAQKAQVRCAADPIELHFSLGRWIRNEWGLNDRSQLARDMAAKGFIDPDDMSAAIIAAYALQLRGQPADFATRAAHDRAYWTQRGVDVDAALQKASQ